MTKSIQKSKISKILFFIIFLAIVLILSTVFLKSFHRENFSNKENNTKISPSVSSGNLKRTTDSVVISKQTVDELVKKAAQQKYLQDVFSDNKKLPLPNSQNIQLQPYQANSDLKPNTNQTQTIATNPALLRCSYNGQSYVAGDIVKTYQSWIRCTPTFYFSPEKPKVRQIGQPAWTAVQ